MRSTLVIGFLILLSACASKRKVEPDANAAVATPVTASTDVAPPAGYERGVRALDAENYQAAADEFDRLLVDHPASELDLATLFNSGAAYEGMGACLKASERYRKVVRSSAGKFPRVEAQALYRVSLAYECLGDNNRTIVALLDAQKRALDLPLPLARAELPARLAAAYNRAGNRAKAIEYFGVASQGLKDVLSAGSSARAQKETLSKTLYGMGRLNTAQRQGEGDPMAFLQSLSMQQPYLLQAIELHHPHWAKRSAQDLILAHDNILRFQVREPARRREYLVRAVQVINELRRIRMVDAGQTEDDVFASIDRVERRLAVYLSELGESTDLTPEARARESLKQSGRLADPSPAAKTSTSKPTK